MQPRSTHFVESRPVNSSTLGKAGLRQGPRDPTSSEISTRQGRVFTSHLATNLFINGYLVEMKLEGRPFFYSSQQCNRGQFVANRYANDL